MKTYIINLKNDNKNLDRTKNELKKGEFNMDNVFRFDAVNGKEIKKWQANIHPFCKMFCTDKMVGIGLSHIKIADYLYSQNLDYALVLEDDIKTKSNRNLENDLNEIIKTVLEQDPNWDIIILHRQGLGITYKKTRNQLVGSTAAYLISKSGMKKISQLQLSWHIDYNRNSKIFNTYMGPNLFDTYELESSFNIFNKPVIFGKSFHFWINQHFANIPILNCNVSVLTLIVFTSLLLSFSIYNISNNKNQEYTNIMLFILILFYTYKYFSNNYVGSLKFCKTSNMFRIIFPILVLTYNFKFIKDDLLSYNFYYIYGLSSLIFQIYYNMDKPINNI